MNDQRYGLFIYLFFTWKTVHKKSKAKERELKSLYAGKTKQATKINLVKMKLLRCILHLCI